MTPRVPMEKLESSLGRRMHTIEVHLVCEFDASTPQTQTHCFYEGILCRWIWS